MEVHFTPVNLTYLVSAILGFITSCILLTFPQHQRSPNTWLGIAVLGISWGQLLGFLLDSGLIFRVPHLFRTGAILALLYIPAAYLYVRQVILPRQLRAADLIHLVPAVIFLVDYLPFFLLPADVKIAGLMNNLKSTPAVNRFNEGWLLPADAPQFMWFIAALIYWVLEVRLIVKTRRSALRFRTRRSRAWRWWLSSFLLFQMLIFLPWYIGLSVGVDPSTVKLVHGAVSAMLTMTALTLFLKPEILYGLKMDNAPQPNLPARNHQSDQEPLVSDIRRNIATLMEQQKVFLRHKYALPDLAHDLGMPPHQLSHQLNSLLKISFNDLMNEYRVKHCLYRIHNENVERITLEALALECGFSNRNSFTQAVKKITGKTPSALIRARRDGLVH